MTTEDVKRKLSAILSADVQGYSRLMGDDEKATVETITAYREVMTGLIKSHSGRVVDAKGDNILLRLATCYSSMGREDEAHAEVAKLLKLNPKLSLAYLAKMYPYKNKVDLDKVIHVLRKAGLN